MMMMRARRVTPQFDLAQVPHYDIHGVNEIHGQHFRHHPPGAKNKENAGRGKALAVRDHGTSSQA